MHELALPHIVLDIGGYQTKVGFSGNSSPSKLLSTPQNIFYNKIQKNFINYEKHLASIFSIELTLDTVGKSIVLVESPFENQQNRAKLYEIMFETFAFEKVALVSDASMALYSHYINSNGGKSDIDISGLTGMVVDMGELQTSIVPIVEGYTIQKGIINFPINGKNITKLISDNILTLNPNLTPNLNDDQFNNIIRLIINQKASVGTDTITSAKDTVKLDINLNGSVKLLEANNTNKREYTRIW